MSPPGRRYVHMKSPWFHHDWRRASLERGGAGSSRGVSSQLCCRRTWHSGGMCSHKVSHDVSDASYRLDVRHGWNSRYGLDDLLHLAAQPSAFRADVTLEPVLLVIAGLRRSRSGIIRKSLQGC